MVGQARVPIGLTIIGRTSSSPRPPSLPPTVTASASTLKGGATFGRIARNAVGDVAFTLRNRGVDLVDNWKIANELPSRGILVRNEQGNYTLKMQGEAAQGTDGFKQLSAPVERSQLTFDAKTGAEITPVGASRFMTQSNLSQYGPAQADGTAFVMTRKQPDKLLADAGRG